MKRFRFASLLLVAAVRPLGAQSLLERSPNMSGTWVPDAGVLQFNFLHRFYYTPPPSKSAINFPTFTLALGLPAHTTFGLHYATRSEIANTGANEVEIYGRWQRSRGPVTVAVTPAFNTAARSFDGEIGIDWTHGPVTLLGAARGMTHAYRLDTARIALAGGAVLRINQYVGVSGDVASLLSTRPGETVAWSAGLVFAIPSSPHTFSLQASNVDVNSIEGSSRRSPLLAAITKKPLYGFEFTIPLHLKRFAPWFHRSPKPVTLGSAAGATVAAEVRMAGIKFVADTITISAGQAVRWTNADPVEHTVTFAGTEGGSPTIPPNASFLHRFDRPGTYAYSCTPHPFMKGVVIVK
jgi:amicyanin